MFDVINNAQQSRVDKLQLAALACLMLVGAAFVYSATMANDAASALPWYDQLWFRQFDLVCARHRRGGGACAWWIITRWRAGRSWSIGSTILLLVAVLIPHIGSMRLGRAALD